MKRGEFIRSLTLAFGAVAVAPVIELIPPDEIVSQDVRAEFVKMLTEAMRRDIFRIPTGATRFEGMWNKLAQ